jgi:formyl-CoA transferase
MRAPYTMQDVDTAADRHPPEIGEHTLEVLREIGLNDGQIDAMRARGVIRAFGDEAAPVRRAG